MNGELFELELLGGTTEQRFRRMRPEVEAMPWGTRDMSLKDPFGEPIDVYGANEHRLSRMSGIVSWCATARACTIAA